MYKPSKMVIFHFNLGRFPINFVAGGKGEDGGTNEESTQQLVQALVDNGIIQLNHKATIRLVDSATTRLVESGSRIVDSSTTRLVEPTTAKIGDSQLAKPSRPIALKTTTSGTFITVFLSETS